MIVTIHGIALQPGDLLLYRPGGVFGWIIAIKTWTRVSHCEVVYSDGLCAASRDGLGVNLYPLRLVGLGYILRPHGTFNTADASTWLRSVQGQKYDWKGLLCFTLAVRQGARDRMFCSEFATRFYRAAGIQPFGSAMDADHVAPATFLASPIFNILWTDGK